MISNRIGVTHDDKGNASPARNWRASIRGQLH
jgi:hypothetical protein